MPILHAYAGKMGLSSPVQDFLYFINLQSFDFYGNNNRGLVKSNRHLR